MILISSIVEAADSPGFHATVRLATPQRRLQAETHLLYTRQRMGYASYAFQSLSPLGSCAHCTILAGLETFNTIVQRAASTAWSARLARRVKEMRPHSSYILKWWNIQFGTLRSCPSSKRILSRYLNLFRSASKTIQRL